MTHTSSPLRQTDPESKARMEAQLALRVAEREAQAAMRPRILKEGREALLRLMPIALGDTGQSRIVARLLLNLYNGDRFPFDATDFRVLDYAIFEDCMSLLRMDKQPQREVHCYFENGGDLFEKLAKTWRVKDFYGKNWRNA